jgi:arginyl-tRNA synthetase
MELEASDFKAEPERGVMDESYLDRDAAIIAFNAVKYFELTNVRRHNYTFSFAAMLNFKGNTAMYLIYAYARIRAVFRRAELEGVSLPILDESSEFHISIHEGVVLAEAERTLALRLLLCPEVFLTFLPFLLISSHGIPGSEKSGGRA